MLGLDDRIADLAGGSWLLALLVALLLGLRHATDPDHLTAVSMLVAGDEPDGPRRARRLGLAWGLGHATTLFAFGLPVVLFGAYLPDAVQRAAELAVGLVIIAVAVRLLVRWRHGYYHVHRHRHGELEHAHPHVHEHAPATDPHVHDRPRHEHRHDALGRTPRAAFGIGLVHGTGGSAGVSLLIVGSVAGDRAMAAVCLCILAAGATLSMALLSSAFGHALARGSLLRHPAGAMPALGVGGVLFGAWYALGALQAVHYPF
jgi:ABC-type nickel/cobalt efflux system permease component RcnA